jgi:hypothetical protein
LMHPSYVVIAPAPRPTLPHQHRGVSS